MVNKVGSSSHIPQDPSKTPQTSLEKEIEKVKNVALKSLSKWEKFVILWRSGETLSDRVKIAWRIFKGKYTKETGIFKNAIQSFTAGKITHSEFLKAQARFNPYQKDLQRLTDSALKTPKLQTSLAMYFLEHHETIVQAALASDSTPLLFTATENTLALLEKAMSQRDLLQSLFNSFSSDQLSPPSSPQTPLSVGSLPLFTSPFSKISDRRSSTSSDFSDVSDASTSTTVSPTPSYNNLKVHLSNLLQRSPSDNKFREHLEQLDKQVTSFATHSDIAYADQQIIKKAIDHCKQNASSLIKAKNENADVEDVIETIISKACENYRSETRDEVIRHLVSSLNITNSTIEHYEKLLVQCTSALQDKSLISALRRNIEEKADELIDFSEKEAQLYEERFKTNPKEAFQFLRSQIFEMEHALLEINSELAASLISLRNECTSKEGVLDMPMYKMKLEHYQNKQSVLLKKQTPTSALFSNAELHRCDSTVQKLMNELRSPEYQFGFKDYTRVMELYQQAEAAKNSLKLVGRFFSTDNENKSV